MTRITIAQIITRLNELVSEFKGQKVHNFGNLHREISDCVNPYLETVGLRYGVWDVYPLDSVYFPILRMQIPNFIEDKRAKETRKGQIVDIEFILKINGDVNVTLQEYANEIKNEKNKKLILKAEERIEELKSQLEEAEENLAILKAIK